MNHHAILTAIGSDRPGLVDEVSQFIFSLGGNIADSRMVNLRGQFAMMVLIGGDEATLDKVRGELPRLAQQTNLQADLRPASSTTGTTGVALPYRLSATAMDQPGLVHRISHLLRTNNVNIESLETTLGAAPVTGAPLFEMELVLAVPRATPIAKLREQLGGLCDELNVDWTLTSA